MSRFRMLLFEARKRAGLTQKKLAEKIGVHYTYISKMESGKESPPSRKATVRLADALGMSNRPVTLYISTKDGDVLQRFTFYLQANVAGAEDVKEIRLVEVEDDQAEEEEEQEGGAATHSVAHPAVKLSARFVGARAEEIEQLIASGGYSEEEEKEVWGALVEMVKRFNAFKEMQRNARKED